MADGSIHDKPGSPAPLGRGVVLLLLAAAIFPIWFNLGNHPLSPRSEGRYASAAFAMAQGQGWLIPRLEGRPHLTKPPLTYWLEAACMKITGFNEWSVRFPSALAGSLTLLIALGLGWKVGGQRVGLLTMGLLAVMPLELIIGRLTITDAMLDLFWTGALAAGYLSVKEPTRRRWAVLLWISVALGLMTKGPLAWVPVGCILVWLLLGGRKDDIKSLRLGWGLPISALPLALWVVAAVCFDPGAVHIWWHEMASRVSGESDLHSEPVWYFIPVFLGGLFPATAMLNLPGLNYSWKSAWADLRAGRDACLWVLAVVLPFVLFSLIKGKLASYLAPLCPPLAILTAVMLDHWISREAEHPPAGVKPPEVTKTLSICLGASLLIGPLIVWGPGWLGGLSIPQWVPRKLAFRAVASIAEAREALATFKVNMEPSDLLMLEAGAICLAAAALWLWWSWKRRPKSRGKALAIVWLAFVAFWLALFSLQNGLDNKTSDPAMLTKMHQVIGPGHVSLVTLGFADSTLSFYNHQETPRVTPGELAAELAAHPRDLVVVAEVRAWKELTAGDPALADRFEQVMGWKLWTKAEPRVVLRVKPEAATRPAAG